jgi:hypothetical protein
VEDYYPLIRIVLDWVPFIVFVGIFVFFMRKGVGGKQAQFMETTLKNQGEQLEETRKMRAALERIAAALERRNN